MGKLLTSLESDEKEVQPVRSVAFHPQGHEVVVGLHEGLAKVFHLSSGSRALENHF